ncbi:polycomb group protein Psc-like [Plodia interpunctella]|uniref:polycomb group protein Psc-like n=1 Tax=Plodia interpunctella TaxID=58824 RepID=UPI0023680688|nr:polycomb group protein Psc-like [Plodia interpunctella]
MVTSNKLPDKKVVRMSEQKNNAVVPQRTLLGEVNEHITCPLCRGYYIDATTIVECLHSFCRSCIIKHLQIKSYCPVCEMMINSAKPNIKLDKALQDIVYKLVPGLFQREMDRRQQFYASRPGPAASATPEQRGEDTERIIFSPEDVISFSLEFADVTDTDSISSKSSDSSEPQNASSITRRYLQCPAVVNISHLKKFLSMKFDIDSSQFAIDILYKRVPLPDYYTLMDIAYIYNWKRNEPMRFFYQIIDYVAIRNRLFDINRKETHFGDRKSSPTSTEDTNVSSPAPNLNDQGSEASSGTDSPMPEDSHSNQADEISKKNSEKIHSKDTQEKNSIPTSKKNDDDEEKSQFLNSFELTAKNSANLKSPVKQNSNDDSSSNISILTGKSNSPKSEDSLKRKFQMPPNTPEMKKLKIEIEKTKIPVTKNISLINTNPSNKSTDTSIKPNNMESVPKNSGTNQASNSLTSAPLKEENKDVKQPVPPTKHSSDTSSMKRANPGTNTISSPKRKPIDSSMITPPSGPKTVSPLKIQVPKAEAQSACKKIADAPAVKKMPDLKPSNMGSLSFPTKQPINKVRMDLLANNSDIDRSKILPQVKSPLGPPGAIPGSGDPLKSLFDSCKINIPSSLSITLTDQKLEARNSSDPGTTDPKKIVGNKNLVASNNNSNIHKVPCSQVPNYIQILKLPDSDPKKVTKSEGSSDPKLNPPNKIEINAAQPKPGKSSDVSAKGPIPNLKPISDTKLAKQSGNFSSPITFQQTFEQQLQSLQSDKKSKLPKNKPQVPKLVPATPKALSAANKPNNPNNKPSPSSTSTPETKTGSALDLSTTNTMPSQLGQQPFDKAFETMQSIANLAKKQNLQSKGLGVMSQTNAFSAMTNRPLTSGVSPLRIPSTTNINQVKSDKALPNSPHTNNAHSRQEIASKNNTTKPINNVTTSVASPAFVGSSHNSPNTQPSPRQTRSPSSSPKLVIAEEKQVSNSLTDQQTGTQPNQLLNTQLPIMSMPKSEVSKSSPGPSKPGLKPVKPLTPVSKIPAVRPPQTPNIKQSPMLNNSEYHALLRHQFEMNWLKVQRQYDMYKNSLNPPPQGDFNKDKQYFMKMNLCASVISCLTSTFLGNAVVIVKMSVVQTSIPFKLRKRVNIVSKKSNIENEDIINKGLTSQRHLKRSNTVDNSFNDSDTDDVSPTKIPKGTIPVIPNSDEDKNICLESPNEIAKPLTSREKEIEWLENFLDEHLETEKSGSLYISGQPGTGKTASLTYILKLKKFRESYKQVYVNCTMMKSATSIYNRICKELQLKTAGSTEKACLKAIESYLQKKHKMTLLVLDEIDQLDSKRQSVLYTIFEWASVARSGLVLVGVANALDLTERSLPRLQARCCLRPVTLHFPPYTKEQIVNIFTAVLADEDKSKLFSPVALQMLAAKIASVSGDMRRALDIGRRVIELAKRSKFSENQSVDCMMRDSTVTVELKQVLEVLNDVYGGSRNIDTDVEEGLPMQQKLILCSLMLMLTKGKNKDVAMGKFYDVYRRVASGRNIQPLELSEALSACALLEARGAVSVAGRGAARGRKLRLRWDAADLAAALRDKPLLAAILSDTAALTHH